MSVVSDYVYSSHNWDSNNSIVHYFKDEVELNRISEVGLVVGGYTIYSNLVITKDDVLVVAEMRVDVNSDVEVHSYTDDAVINLVTTLVNVALLIDVISEGFDY